MTDNIIEIARALSSPVGLKFSGTCSNQFTDLVVRKNLIRQVADTNHSLRTDMTGVSATQCARLIAENSVIADSGTTGSTRAVVFTNCGSTKLFNNQDDFGTLVRGYNTVSGLFVQALADAVQDVLFPICRCMCQPKTP